VDGARLNGNGRRADAAGALRRALAALERRAAPLERLPTWELRVAPLTRDPLAGLLAPPSADGALADALGRGRELGGEAPARGTRPTSPVRPLAARRRTVVSPAPRPSAVSPPPADPARALAAAQLEAFRPARTERHGTSPALRPGAQIAAPGPPATLDGGDMTVHATAVPPAPAVRSASKPSFARRRKEARAGDPRRLPDQGTDRYLEPLDLRGGGDFSPHGSPDAPPAGPPAAQPFPAAAPAGERPQSLAALVRLWQHDPARADVAAPPAAGAASAIPLAEIAPRPRFSLAPGPAEAAALPSTALPELTARQPSDASWSPALGAPAPGASPLLEALSASPAASPLLGAPPASPAASPPLVAPSASPAATTALPVAPAPGAPSVPARPPVPAASAPAAEDVEQAVERLLLSELRRHGIEVDAG